MIVADASWIIALRDPTDAHHRQAVEVNEHLGEERAVLAAVTFAECLVSAAELGELDASATLLRGAFDIVQPDPDAPIRWAALRADTGLRLPDAIVLETALHHGARAIATFDDKLGSRAVDRGIEIFGARPRP